MRIRHYPIEHYRKFTLDLPDGAIVLRVESVGAGMRLHVYEDASRPMTPRTFGVFLDEAEDVPEDLVYLGFVQAGQVTRYVFEYFTHDDF